MESLPLAFSSGWASGVNCYLVVLVLGIADQVGDYDDIPDALGRWDVLTIAGILYAMEFVADKIPYVDSTWDVVSTLIRPTAGAVVGALLAGDVTADQSLDKIVLASVGGVTALLSHLVKGGVRLAVNTSPEPVTNIGISIARGRRRVRPWSRSRSSTRGPPPPSPACCSRSGWCCCSSSPGWSAAAGGAGRGGVRRPPGPAP